MPYPDARRPVIVEIVERQDVSPPIPSARIEHARGRVTDALILGAAFAVPLLGRAMSFDAAGRVWFFGWDRMPLPTLCPSRWIGFRCLTCGVTRSIIALMHGDARTSLALHPFGWLILVLIVSQIPYRIFRIARPDHRVPVVEHLGIAGLVVAMSLIVAARILSAIVR